MLGAFYLIYSLHLPLVLINFVGIDKFCFLHKMLHRKLPRNIRIRSEIFPLFMNSNPDGEGPH